MPLERNSSCFGGEDGGTGKGYLLLRGYFISKSGTPYPRRGGWTPMEDGPLFGENFHTTRPKEKKKRNQTSFSHYLLGPLTTFKGGRVARKRVERNTIFRASYCSVSKSSTIWPGGAEKIEGGKTRGAC